MPSKDPDLRLGEIVREITLIDEFVAGRSATEIEVDQKTVHAIERSLQIICEAATKLGADAEVLIPGQPWRDIRGLGNVLRHDYDNVSFDRIWDTIENHLGSLCKACAAYLSTRSNEEKI